MTSGSEPVFIICAILAVIFLASPLGRRYIAWRTSRAYWRPRLIGWGLMLIIFVTYVILAVLLPPSAFLPAFLLALTLLAGLFVAVWAVRRGRKPASAMQKKEAMAMQGAVAGKQMQEAGLPGEWETEIASDLSFYERVTPDMLSHVPQDKRANALQEYARLHPDEAYWDGQALVRKGKK